MAKSINLGQVVPDSITQEELDKLFSGQEVSGNSVLSLSNLPYFIEQIKKDLEFPDVDFPLSLEDGGTGKTTRQEAMYGLAFLGFNPVDQHLYSNDTPESWAKLGPGYAYINYNNGQILQGLTDQLYGPLLNYVYGGIVMQQFLCSNGRIYYRYGLSSTNTWELGWRREDVGDVLPVSRGGTGNNHGVLTTLANNPITSKSNDTVAQWMTKQTGVYWFNTSGLLNGQPTQYGYLLNIAGNGSNCINQFWLPPGSNRIYYRGTNGATNINGAMGDFVAIRNMSDVVPIAQGGTGLTSAPSLLVNLASTTASSPLSATPRPGITGTLGLAHGGTGGTTAAAARTNLGVLANSTYHNSNTHQVKVGDWQVATGFISHRQVADKAVATATANFGFTFDSAPIVFLQDSVNHEAYSAGGWTGYSARSVTTTNFIANMYNGAGYECTMGCYWVAIGKRA